MIIKFKMNRKTLKKKVQKKSTDCHSSITGLAIQDVPPDLKQAAQFLTAMHSSMNFDNEKEGA